MNYRVGARRPAAEYEKAITEWWQKHHTFEQSVESRPIDKSYVFYDGPPFITGLPHFGTLLSSIVKDAVPRYYTMHGYRVERRWGWDCHGLPAENYVEKQLGIKDRRDIGTKWSLEDYIVKARESMVASSELWRSTIDRIGRWVDFDHAYRTMDKDFMESVWWAFKKLYEAGKIYEGRKVLMYDTKFATPVSKAEVNMDNDAYQEVTDPSAYVKFELIDSEGSEGDDIFFSGLPELTSEDEGVSPVTTGANDPSPRKTVSSPQHAPIYLLAWTTTPWTLPANLCLAINPELEYGIYQVDGENLIVATSRAEQIFPGLTPEQTFKGAKLAGLRYTPIINMPETLFDKSLREDKNNLRRDTYTVLSADFVSADDGTGIVHIAPAYGEDDYALAENHQLDFADVLDENGYYLPEMAEQLHQLGVRDTDDHGIQVWAGNKIIAKILEEQGIVYRIEYIRHEYPFNPRSKERIIYRAFPSWFFDIQGQKPLMLEQNEYINWFPGYLKHGRFAKNIEQAPDWNLSRDRFWATAMPVWQGDKGTVKVVGSYKELEELSGQTLEDYHRPWVDQIEFDIDGEHFTRIEKVFDCWFESGSMPFAQLHYPFENKEKFERNYPADFIVEYVGQVRAWFYYVHTVNTALASIGAFGDKAKKGHKNAFKNVITTGTLAGNDGRKMSKSLGNFTDPNLLMDQFSADSLRLLLLSSPVLSGEDFSLLDKDVSDTYRKLSMIWNVFDFFTTYASIAGITSEELEDLTHADTPVLRSFERASISKNSASSTSVSKMADSSTSDRADTSALAFSKNPLDLWIISRLSQLQEEITSGMEEYNLPRALSGVLPFVDDLSNWFVRRSRRRFSKNSDPADQKSAFTTLYYVLVHLSKILAPFVPFLAEELYQKITGKDFAKATYSVHLCSWPELPPQDAEILEQMSRTRAIISDALAFRMRHSETEPQIKVRQPLVRLVYPGAKLPDFYEQIVADEVNVKEVQNGEELLLDKTLTPALEREGQARDLIRAIQAARKHASLRPDDHIRLSLGCALPEGFEDFVTTTVLADEFKESANYSHDEIAKISGENITISLEKI